MNPPPETLPAPDSPAPARRPDFAVLAAGVIAVLHFLWLTAHLAPAIMSPDANGYVVQARLIAQAGRTSFSPESPVQYVGIHWLETERGLFHSRYPAGLPLLMAAAWQVGGLKAALYLNPLFASATVLLVFLLARRGMGAGPALFAALVVATVPVTNQHALDADAHVAAAFFLVAGTLALLRFAETRALLPGLAAGGLLGIIPTVRYPEAIVGLVIAGWLAWRIRPLGRVWPAVVGAAVPLGALFVHNTVAYGAFWRTGYALTNEQTGFGFSYFAGHALPYLQALGGPGLALVFAFGVAGLAARAVDARERAEGVLFAGLVGPLVLLYMAYYFGGGGPGGAAGNLRFLVPTFPFFAVGGAWLLARLADQLGGPGRAAFGVVAALQLLLGLGNSAATLASARTSLTAAAGARTMAEKEFPRGSVVILDRQLAESLDATGEWKLVEESLVAGLGPGGLGGPGGPGRAAGGFRPMPGMGPRALETDPDAPSPQQAGKNRAQQERYAGLRPAERRERVWADVQAWAGTQPIFWIARNLEAVDAALPAVADYRTVAEIDAPAMLGPGGGGGGPMPAGPGGGMPGRGARGGAGRGPAGGAFGPPGAGPAAGGPGGLPGGRGGFSGAAGAKLRVIRLEWPKP